MKLNSNITRLRTIFFTVIVCFLCYFSYFMVKKQCSPSPTALMVVNVSSLPDIVIHKSQGTEKVIAESDGEEEQSVAPPKVSDGARQDNNPEQGQGVPGGGVPWGVSVPPLTGWPLLRHRADVVQQVCRRFRVQHAPASSDDEPRGTTVAGNRFNRQ